MRSNVETIDTHGNDTPNLESVHGIPMEFFIDAITDGISDFKSVNKYYPRTAGGSRAWEKIVATLRQRVVEECDGWCHRHQNGMALLVNAARRLTIVVTSGNKDTGISETLTPKTRNKKGPAVQDMVNRNYSLFSESQPEGVSSISVDGHQTWVLLYHIDKESCEVRSELSLPTEIEISGSKGGLKVSSWAERVLFVPVPFDGQSFAPLEQEFTEEQDFFEPKKK